MKNITILLLAAVLLLPACSTVGIATGVGASAGMAASQEGGIATAATDAKIRFQINELWFSHDVEMFRKVGMTVNQGRVLLTGVVQNPEHRVEAVRLAWQPKGVKQVINEIRVADSEGITGFARDTWITTRLRTVLTFDRDILSINYSIDTVSGIVYLMGVGQSQSEINKVIQKARTIPDVRQVVSYVKLRGQGLDEPAPADFEPVEPSQQSAPGESATESDYNPADFGYQQPDYQQPGYQGIESEPLPLVQGQ